ncbi:MAG: hypothetical protein ACOCUV_02185 [bacterium]
MDRAPDFTGLVPLLMGFFKKHITSPEDILSMRRGDTISMKTNYEDLFMGINPKRFEAVFHSYNSKNNYATFLCENEDGRISSVQVDMNRAMYGKDHMELPVYQFVEIPCNKKTQEHHGYDVTLGLKNTKRTFF